MSTVRKSDRRFTLADYAQWDGDWELMHGEAIAMSPSPFGPHKRAVSALSGQIFNSITADKCDCTVYAGLDWIVSDETVVRPDVMIVCGEEPTKHLQRPPALTIEVLSPSTANYDRTTKRGEYERQGVEHYLIVDIDQQTIYWLRLQPSGSYEDVSANIPTNGRFDVTLRDGCVLHFNSRQVFGRE